MAEVIAALPRTVLVDEAVPGPRAPQIFADNDQGVYLAGRHLASWGHRQRRGWRPNAIGAPKKARAYQTIQPDRGD